MAAVAVLPPTPVANLDMASRRVPLQNVPNALNSPLRPAHPSHTGKRTRAQTTDPRDLLQAQPPAKRQAIELAAAGQEENVDPRSPRRRAVLSSIARQQLDDPLPRRSAHVPTALEQKFKDARKTPSRQDSSRQQRTDKSRDGASEHQLTEIRQWQKHYKRQFPGFVFYFDNIPDDQRIKIISRIRSLGAHEEKFFSNKVTHVVTTRPIPTELASTSPDDETKPAPRQKTIQPASKLQDYQRPADRFDANLQRRSQAYVSSAVPDIESVRALNGSGADILSKARELRIKIWGLEKLGRVLNTLFNNHDTVDEQLLYDPRPQQYTNNGTRTAQRQTKDADLEQLLRNEKRLGPADRDLTVTTSDMQNLRGYYLYIHDLEEATKPTLMREYSKVENVEDGKWPQWRRTNAGRCPFIEDPNYGKEAAPRKPTRAVSANAALPALAHTAIRRSPRKLSQPVPMAKPLDPPTTIPAKRQSSAEGMLPMFGSAQQSLRGHTRLVGGEPMASGVQPSNVTSAIRSQIVSSAALSSTAANPNRRLGDSKEVSALKRKVLMERGASALSNNSVPSSYLNDVRAALNRDDEPPPRAAKRKAQETLGVLHEDEEDTRDEARPTHRKPAVRRKKPVEREPKPGYCENCRDKFDDFEEHVASRKHRKFATTQENWGELDALLSQLRRPHKVV